MTLRNYLMVILCFASIRCARPVKNEVKSNHLHNFTIGPGEILKRDHLYDEGTNKCNPESELLHSFIENLPQNQRGGLKGSLYELKRLRNKEL